MKKLLPIMLILGAALISSGCDYVQNLASLGGDESYTPTMKLDYDQGCGHGAPVVSGGNTITFGSGNNSCAGRLYSSTSYKDISKITATVDLSKLQNQFINATFYAISNPKNPTQAPEGDNYCDAGGTHDDWNCQELDFFETNGNSLLQSTMHIGDGGSSAPQRYEMTYTETAVGSECYDQSKLNTSITGMHSMTEIDMAQPFDMTVLFDEGNMTVTYTQGDASVEVYNLDNGAGYEGSGTIDRDRVISSMADGYWLEVSFWQGWSPGAGGIWTDACPWGNLCSTDGKSIWSISNITVWGIPDIP